MRGLRRRLHRSISLAVCISTACALATIGSLVLPVGAQRGFPQPGRGFPDRGFPPMQDFPGSIQWIDTHVHLDGKIGGTTDFEGAAQTAVAAMDQAGIKKSLVLPRPQPPANRNPYECDLFSAALKRLPERFAFLCGGGSLNPMIQEARDQTEVSEEARGKFEEKASQLLAQGAVGFGEMTAMHLSHFSGHPFESVGPDHPLFLLLADITAKHDVVIDLHMDAVADDMSLRPASPRRRTRPRSRPTWPAWSGSWRTTAKPRSCGRMWALTSPDTGRPR